MPLLSSATGIFFAGQGSSAFNQGGGGGGGGSASADGWQANTIITNSSSGGGPSFGIRGVAGLSDGGVFVSGSENADDIGFAMLTDTDGDVKWVKQLNANAYYARFYSASANGTSLFAAGTDYGWGANEAAAGRTNVSASIAAKFAKSDGSVDWMKVIKKTSIGSVNDGFDTSISNSVADSDGNLWILGRHRGSNNESNLHIAKINGSNGALMSMYKRTKSPDTKQDNIYGIKLDASGNIYLLWQVYDPNSNNAGVGVQKLNSSFVIQWTKMYSDTTYNSDRGYQFDLDSSGNVYVSGYTGQTPSSGTIAKLNTADGTIAWSKQLNTGTNPGTGVDDIKGMVVDNDDNIWLCGPYGPGTPYNFVLTKYNSSGVIQNQWGIAGGNGYTLYNSINTMDIDGNGNVLLGFQMSKTGSARTSIFKLPAILEAGTFTDLVITDRTAVDYAYSPSAITHTTYSMSDVSSDFETADYNSGSYALLPIFTNTFTKDVDPFTGGSGGGGGGASITWGGARGLIAGGYTAGGQKSNTIDYINISTPGNATDFGDLTIGRYNGATMSNATKAVFGGGIVVNNSNVLDYVTVATPGNAIDFGDMSAAWAYSASEGDGTYGVMAGGFRYTNQVLYNDIEYITIDTPSNSSSFGNLSGNQTGRAMGTNGTIGVITTGNDGSGSAYSSSMLTITMATPGNAVVSSGTLLDSWTYVQNLPGDDTYLLVGAGRRSNGEDANGWTNMVEKFATATQTGATDHGDLTNSGGMSAASSDGTYAFWAGREGSSSTPSGQSSGRYHTIEQMSIATGGNSTDFGTFSEYIEAGFGSSGNAS